MMKEKIAKFISGITSLYVTIPVFGFVIIGIFSRSPKEFFVWALFFLLLVGILPVIFIYINVKRGKITDFGLNERSQRGGTMLTSSVGALLLAILYKSINAPHELFSLAIILTITALVFYLITNYWKISMHAGCFAGMVTVAGIFIHPFCFLLFLFVPIIAWARVYLHRHTIAQTLVGAGRAIVLVLACFHILGII